MMPLRWISLIFLSQIPVIRCIPRGGFAKLIREGRQEACIQRKHQDDECMHTSMVAGPRPKCIPFRSPESCPLEFSFPTQISTRASFIRNKKEDLEKEGWWFHHLENKIAAYAFSTIIGISSPQMYYCGKLTKNAINTVNNAARSSFVIRTTGLHSSQGIYIFPRGLDGGVEYIRGISMTFEDILSDMNILSGSNQAPVIVEEYIPGPNGRLPTEYKFHMFNGKIGSINVVHNRGTSCGCWAEIDEAGERLDQFGCFTPSPHFSAALETHADQCFDIDFNAGALHPYPMKGFDLCSQVPTIDPCTWSNMLSIAKKVSRHIGVYIRIDMFVSESGQVYIQEYTSNHMNGLRHCSAKKLDGGCIDSCFQGKLWQNIGGNSTLGGFNTLNPMSEFLSLKSDNAMCAMASSFVQHSPDIPCESNLHPDVRPSMTGGGGSLDLDSSETSATQTVDSVEPAVVAPVLTSLSPILPTLEPVQLTNAPITPMQAPVPVELSIAPILRSSTDALPIMVSAFVPTEVTLVDAFSIQPTAPLILPTLSSVAPSPAPVKKTAAPVIPTMSPIKSTNSPIVPMALYTESIVATATPSSASILPTPTPIQPTYAPVPPTVAPVLPTSATTKPTSEPRPPSLTPIVPSLSPIAPSTAPVKKTAAPVIPTLSPIKPTNSPIAPMAVPVESIVVSAIPSSAPVLPTTTPIRPIYAPVPPTLAPVLPTSSHTKPPAEPRPPSLTPIVPTLSTIDPSTASVKKTAAPVIPTLSPTKPTDSPFAPMAVPVVSIVASVIPSSDPVLPTTTPVQPTNAPVPPTLAPVVPTSSPTKPTAEARPPSSLVTLPPLQPSVSPGDSLKLSLGPFLEIPNSVPAIRPILLPPTTTVAVNGTVSPSQWKVPDNAEGLVLTVQNAMSSIWQDEFARAFKEWDSGMPDTLILTKERVSVDPECTLVIGKSKMCDGDYGETPWRGVTSILVSPDDFIIATASKINNFYLDEVNKAPGRNQYIVCHEMGHAFGLAHSDEDFNNADLFTCMDYTRTPINNQSPSVQNFETLAKFYKRDGTRNQSTRNDNPKADRNQSTRNDNPKADGMKDRALKTLRDLESTPLDLIERLRDAENQINRIRRGEDAHDETQSLFPILMTRVAGTNYDMYIMDVGDGIHIEIHSILVDANP